MIDFRRLLPCVVGLAAVLLANRFIFDERAISNVRILAIAAAVSIVLFLCYAFQRREGSVAGEWHYLTRGVMDWLGTILSLGMSGFLFYIYFFVGSARWDGASQMKIALALAIFFGAGGAVCFFFSFLLSTRWNDTMIQRRSPFGVKTIRFTDITSVVFEEWSGYARIEAADGTRIRVATHQNGSDALAEMVMRYAPVAKASAGSV